MRQMAIIFLVGMVRLPPCLASKLINSDIPQSQTFQCAIQRLHRVRVITELSGRDPAVLSECFEYTNEAIGGET